MDYLLRLAKPSDALACSAIVNNWIDNTDWMPRIHPPKLITEMIENGIPKREFWVIGEPVVGYLSFSLEAQQVMGLYVSQTGVGLGKALLDRVKIGKASIKLWSHSLNISAHRFYLREGFKIIGAKRVGDDGIEEICFEWVGK